MSNPLWRHSNVYSVGLQTPLSLEMQLRNLHTGHAHSVTFSASRHHLPNIGGFTPLTEYVQRHRM